MRSWFGALLVVLWPTVSTASDITTPPPGSLVDVGGHKVHLYCTGNAGPTVVLIAGASSFSIDWALVQPKLSARACAFDRPGYASSDAAGVLDDGMQVVRDLHEALVRTNQPRPYVLVGHSLGGFVVRLFYDMYPDDVGGVVLLDAAHEDGPEFLAGNARTSRPTLMRLRQLTASQEHPLHDVPLVVLSHGVNSNELQDRLQNDLAKLSTNVIHVTIANADHEIHLYAPDETATWINEVIEAVRNGQPLGPGFAQ